ncbi:MAG: hypothetical protein OEZ06_24250 [Myxococcales bacterium]|nr:hypothetical protein [Myxococcales bacterium]
MSEDDRRRRMKGTRLVGDFALTPDGEPNMTRAQFEAQLQAERAEQAEAFERGRRGARKAGEVRGFRSGGGDVAEAMTRLALSFHAIRAEHEAAGFPGVRPWDPEAFWRAAAERLDDLGSEQAAAFVLSVWNSTGPWTLQGEDRQQLLAEDPDCPRALPFEHATALASWDEGHRGAYVGWAEDPWWG